MFSKAQLIQHITNEFRILKHLGTKINHEQHLGHKFTESQRTIKDLMVYLGYSLGKLTQLVAKGEQDMSVFADYDTLANNFDPSQRETVLDTELKEIITLIESLNDEALATNMTLFGTTKTRAEFLITMLVAQLAAYKMQLFLQLKHAGRTELNSMNLWAGIDKA